MNTSDLRVRVVRKATEADDIVSFELVHAEGDPLPAFSAGSHIDVALPNGLSRQYSLCNDPDESHRYLIAVLRDVASRGGSESMHRDVIAGDILVISVPKNHFALARDAAHSVLFAGGIGITPILCMAERLSLTNASFELHYSTRAPERTAFRERIAASAFAPRVHYHFDNGDLAQKLQLDALLATLPFGSHLYVCGPQAFMNWMLGTARARAWPEAQLHWEFFAADAPKSASDASFAVRLASSGKLVTVAAEQSVVQALAAAGIEVAVSCEQGVCGTCLTRVLEGEPDHRDLYLTPQEQSRNDQFTPCCSRSKSAVLVLDL